MLRLSEDICVDKDDPVHEEEWIFLEMEGEGKSFACSPKKKTVYIDFSSVYSGVAYCGGKLVDPELFMLFNYSLQRYNTLMEMVFHNFQHEDLHIVLGKLFRQNKKYRRLPDLPEVQAVLFWLDDFINENEIYQVVENIKKTRWPVFVKDE